MAPTSSTPPSGPSSGDAKPAFEAALEQLQNTVKKLESGELTLEQSLQQFEEGVRLTRICQEQLSAAEKRVEILMKVGTSESGEPKAELQPFPTSKS
jgi:exodeoxyribonuclease VII small subunit